MQFCSLKKQLLSMKNKMSLLSLYVLIFLISGCCNYCAESQDHELIGISLYDKSTGELIEEGVEAQNFELESESNNQSILTSKQFQSLPLILNLSVAREKGTEDKLKLKWTEGCNCVIAELAVEYVLWLDNDCCDSYRSVKVTNIKSVCTDPDLEFIETNGRVSEIKIMVEI